MFIAHFLQQVQYFVVAISFVKKFTSITCKILWCINLHLVVLLPIVTSFICKIFEHISLTLFRGRIFAKRINVRIEHVRHSKCRDDFLR